MVALCSLSMPIVVFVFNNNLLWFQAKHAECELCEGAGYLDGCLHHLCVPHARGIHCGSQVSENRETTYF